MSLLHVYFNNHNQQAFQRLLDSSQHTPAANPSASSSGGKSWNRPSPLSSTHGHASEVNVNARDPLGRTVLHLAATSKSKSAPEYIRLLLGHPHININLQDYESRWSALHRALYHGNLASATILLQRQDLDVDLKDLEGYRAFDLYNSTVENTKPSEGALKWDLFTWGTNRNAALGLGDADDRTYPDQVVIERMKTSEHDTLDTRFEPVRIQQMKMAKLHTAVVTDEPRGNIRACGFGSGGRLGIATNTQYSLLPIPLPSSSGFQSDKATSSSTVTRIISVALGQDHTLALTSTGEVLSWGLNRFSQLGYLVEVSGGGSDRAKGEEIQTVPRKIPGLRNKFIAGVAACKTASACWSHSEVWTWGTNGGQLGYDKNAQPVQISPRKVAKITLPVLDIAMNDNAMACLLETRDVICLWNDLHFKVIFPAQAFPSEMTTYRPPQAIRNASIQKVTSCESVFAALSLNGEVFTFQMPSPHEISARESNGNGGGAAVKPQRVWALRKQFSAVKDVELGSDGTIIICTESGHVFVRSRNLKAATNLLGGGSGNAAGKAFKFQRVPLIQRAIRVCANSTGAFGVIRSDAQPGSVVVVGELVQESLRRVQPYLAPNDSMDDVKMWGGESQTSLVVDTQQNAAAGVASPLSPRSPPNGDDVEEEDFTILNDLAQITRLVDFTRQNKTQLPSAFGSDLSIVTQSNLEIPAHQAILAARCPVLHQILSGGGPLVDKDLNLSIKSGSFATTKNSSNPFPSSTKSKLIVNGCHPISLLILLYYLYSDEVVSPWDPRIVQAADTKFTSAKFKIKSAQVKAELQRLAKGLGLSELARCLEAPVKRDPTPSVAKHMFELLKKAQAFSPNTNPLDPIRPDVVLVLGDREVRCHSAILRARCELFASFFDLEDWTKTRWEDGVVRMGFGHLKWKVVDFVVRFIYGGDTEMFDKLEFVNSTDEVIDFGFEVMSAANELLLDRLVLLCSTVILKRVNMNNACSVLTDATHYHAVPLIRAVQLYLTRNLETALESRMLDDLPVDVLRQLAAFVQEQQTAKSPVSRSGRLVQAAMEKNKEWVALQDFPQPIARSYTHHGSSNRMAKMSPPGPSRKKNLAFANAASPPASPSVRPQISPTLPVQATSSLAEDEVFLMDESVPSLSLGGAPTPLTPVKSDAADGENATPSKSPGWKVPIAPRVDMKAIMAEAASRNTNNNSRPSSNRATPIPSIRPGSTPSSSTAAATLDTNWRTPIKTGTTRGPSDVVESSSFSGQRAVSASGAPGAGSSPWNMKSSGHPPPPSPTPGNPNPASGSPTVAPPMRMSRSREEGGSSLSSSLKEKGIASPRIPGMGPVITPTKQAVKKGGESVGMRRVASNNSSGNPWVLLPVQPVVQQSSSSSGSIMSFTAIQQLQQEQEEFFGPGKAKDKRSLKEIQEEEKARQVEEDFMKWWAAEEERVRVEQEVAAVAAAVGDGTKSQGGKPKPRRKPKPQQPQQKDGQPKSEQPKTQQKPQQGESSGAGGGTRNKGRQGRRVPGGPTASTSTATKGPQVKTSS